MSNKFEISPFGNMLVYKKGYSSDFVRELIEVNNLSGLRIFDHLDKLDSLDFLSEFSFLEQLSISCIFDQNYTFLKKLSNLKTLSIDLSIKENNIIDLSDQINLQNLTLQWRKGKIIGLDKCKNITSLCLVGYKEKDFKSISSLVNLENLIVKTAFIENCNGIENFVKLKSLLLGNCKKLSELKGLERINNLTSLSFELCSQIKDYSEVGSLSNLESLKIADCKEMVSINFLEKLSSLKKLFLLGNTDVLDGDLMPAKNIKDVVYKHRKHYNVKIANEEHEELIKRNLEKIKNL